MADSSWVSVAAARARIAGRPARAVQWEVAQYELDGVGAADLIEQTDEQVRADRGRRRDGALREHSPLLISDVGAQRWKQDRFLVCEVIVNEITDSASSRGGGNHVAVVNSRCGEIM